MNNTHDDLFDSICNTCQGAGDFEGDFCTRCSGSGYIVLEEIEDDLGPTEEEWEAYVEATGGNDHYKDIVQ